MNFLSEGIVNADGTPGPNYGAALQYSASDTTTYQLTPPKTAYSTLPPALVGGTWTPYVCEFLGYAQNSVTSCVSVKNIQTAKSFENGLPDDYVQYLLTGGTGQTNKTPDMRVSYDGQNASNLPPGPYQLTNTANPSYPYPYDAYAASPVHRFMQMQQQLDCDASAVTTSNGWGCTSDLYPWVEVTIGAGSNGAAPPSPFTNESTGEGSTSMGFYNVQNGDVPYFTYLANTYTMSDNYHQGIKGGTGANHIMIGTSDAIWFEQGGKPQEPPKLRRQPSQSYCTPLTGNPNSAHRSRKSESAVGHEQLLHPGRLWRRSGGTTYGDAGERRTTAAAPTSSATTRSNRASRRK